MSNGFGERSSDFRGRYTRDSYRGPVNLAGLLEQTRATDRAIAHLGKPKYPAAMKRETDRCLRFQYMSGCKRVQILDNMCFTGQLMPKRPSVGDNGLQIVLESSTEDLVPHADSRCRYAILLLPSNLKNRNWIILYLCLSVFHDLAGWLQGKYSVLGIQNFVSVARLLISRPVHSHPHRQPRNNQSGPARISTA